jgi:pSer/pThr/pTyr-binding forkhead associated (FHA) protein
MKIKILHNGIETEEFQLVEGQEYIIGRDDACDLQLLDAKISRKHARIYFEETWKVELLSQVGQIYINGQNTSHSPLQDADQLQIHNYVLVCFSEAAEQGTEEVELEANSEEQQENTNPAFMDETTAGGNQAIENYLRIQYGNEAEELIKISGNHWVLGRSDSNDIQLKDQKSSRKHLVIRFSGSYFFAKDLGSSNGSFLAGNQMNPNQEYEIKSGDQIEIGSTKIIFEQRNPQFEEILSKLPVQVHHHAVMQVGDNQINLGTNLPSLNEKSPGALGFVIPEKLGGGRDKEKNKKIMIYAVVAILLSFAAYESTREESGSKNNASTVKEIKSAYEQLSPEQQSYVDNAFSAAHRFFNLEQWDLAVAEIQKIHRYLPEGYTNKKMPEALPSKEMLSIAETALATLRDQERLEEEQKARAAFDAKINEVLQECKARVSSMNEAEASICLEFVFVNRPNHPEAQAILQTIRDRKAREQQQRAIAASRNAQIAKGQSLYNTAKSFEQKGDILEAIAAYKKHISSSYPDPRSLKSKSRSRLNLLQQNLSGEVEKLRRKMHDYFEGDQLKESIQTANQILKLAPDNTDALDKKAMAISDLNRKLREDYQDSIFREAHGDIKGAKQIWRRILIKDIKDGDYYNKARIKLKKHGEG